MIPASMGFLKTLFQPTSTELRKGSGTGIRTGTLFIAAVAVLCGGVFAMQKNQDKSSIAAKPQIVPITEEQHHQLVLDNEYVRVFHVEVPPHSETLYHQHDMDYVFVTLGDSKVASERVDGKSTTLELKDGETRFTKGGFAHKAVNLSDKPFVNVTIELKRRAIVDSASLSGICEGFVCVMDLLKANNFKCFQLMTAGSGTGMGLPEPAERLVVMSTDGVDADTDREVKVGDVLWKTKGLSLKIRGNPPGDLDASKKYPLRAVVCEFARPGEDLLKPKK